MPENSELRKLVSERVDLRSKIIEISILILTADIILLTQFPSTNMGEIATAVSEACIILSSIVLMGVAIYTSLGMIGERAQFLDNTAHRSFLGISDEKYKMCMGRYMKYYHDPFAVLLMAAGIFLMFLSIIPIILVAILKVAIFIN